MFSSIRIGSPRGAAQVIIVGQFKGGQPLAASLDPKHKAPLQGAAQRREATGEACRLAEAFAGETRLIIVGLGEQAEFSGETLRNIAGALGRRLAQTGEERIAIELTDAALAAGMEPAMAGKAFGEGIGLIGWLRDEFRGSGCPAPKRRKLTLASSDKAFTEGMKQGLALSESSNYARTLSETPPNICTPAWIAQQAQKLAKDHGMTCRVIKGAQLEKERLVGLINVGKASENEPCLIRLEYTPAQARRGLGPAVLVGKTMTYDSGGLSIKVNGNMRGMKRDKDGGCAVLGAMHAIATVVKPKRKVVALLSCAENAISDEAYRPDDIITYRNGVTVEVTNTDAEGRLVLADALCWACEKEKPAFIVDVATLTGGVVVALGSTYAGVWCSDEGLSERLGDASKRSGERIWPLPMHREYREMMKSDVADILNSAPVRKAHPIQGAAFLTYFVQPDIPWAHIDIAGVHAVDSDCGPYIKNSSTGFGARLIAELVEHY